MKELNNFLPQIEEGKSSKKVQHTGKSFGYQVLGFGAGGAGFVGMTATGGTESDCGGYRIHTFTGSSNFVVSELSPNPEGNVVEYLIVAGGSPGACGSKPCIGGGGGGGFRESPGATAGGYSVSPLGVSPAAAVPVSCSPGTYPVVVASASGTSTFACISSAGGGAAGSNPAGAGTAGGSGGGGGGQDGAGPGGAGNTPPVTPPQGNPGGSADFGGGGGGAGGAGAGPGAGPGAAPGISPGCKYYSGGGGSGYGGPASAGRQEAAESAPANSGGGGGGGNPPGPGPSTHGPGGTGGTGVVILRYRLS